MGLGKGNPYYGLYTGRFCPEGVPFKGLGYMKGQGNLSIQSVKRPIRANKSIYGCEKLENVSWFCDFS